MTTDTTEMGGHRCVDTGTSYTLSGSSTPITLWRCTDCGTENSYSTFMGFPGCPKRPESLNFLTVRPGEGLGARARERWLVRADATGIKLSVWSAAVPDPGPGGGKAAEMTFEGSPYHLIVTRPGRLAVHPGNDDDCAPCDELRRDGAIIQE